MDEVVEAVAGGVAINVLRQQRALRIGLGRRRLNQQELPLRVDSAQDPFARRGIDSSLLRASVARPPPIFAVGQRPVLETNYQFAALYGRRALAVGEYEAALPAGGFLHVVPFGAGRGNLQANPPHLLGGTDRERIAGIILGGLDVILVGVSPVQLYLLAVVRNQIRGTAPASVAPLRNEVALGVVARKEAGQMIVHVGLCGCVLTHLGEPLMQQADGWAGIRIGIDSQSSCGLAGGVQLRFEYNDLLGAGQVELRLHLGQQVVVEKRHDLRRLQVHDPVDAEVEVASVKLEHLAQQPLEAVQLYCCARRGTQVLGVGIRHHSNVY